MHAMHGMTNAIYWFDVQNYSMCNPKYKLGVFLDATMTVEDYRVGFHGESNDDLFKGTTIGQALLGGMEKETLGWPSMFKWRHEEGRAASDELEPLEECGGYVITYRQLKKLPETVLRPFVPTFNFKQQTQQLDALSGKVNARFRTNPIPTDRFFVEITKMFPWLSHYNEETNEKIVEDSVAICIHLWNIVNSPQLGSGKLGDYAVDAESRFSERDGPRTKKGDLPRILTKLWTWHEPRAEALQTDPAATFKAPYKVIDPIEFIADKELLDYVVPEEEEADMDEEDEDEDEDEENKAAQAEEDSDEDDEDTETEDSDSDEEDEEQDEDEDMY